MELVLVRLDPVSTALIPLHIVAHLQVTKLSELLPAIIKLTAERLDLLVDDLVSAHISTLRKGLATNLAAVGSLACVSSLMCL